MQVSVPTFRHDCPACVYLGSEDRIVNRWDNRGLSCGRWRDFYLCRSYGADGPVFTARYGSGPGDYIATNASNLERWDFAHWAAQAGHESDDHAVPLKALHMLHRDCALERGFAVYRHFEVMTKPYIVVSPSLGPIEHQIIGIVVDYVVTRHVWGGSRLPLNASGVRRITEAMLARLEEVADRTGAVTRWNAWGRKMIHAETDPGIQPGGDSHGDMPGASGVDHGPGRAS